MANPFYSYADSAHKRYGRASSLAATRAADLIWHPTSITRLFSPFRASFSYSLFAQASISFRVILGK